MNIYVYCQDSNIPIGGYHVLYNLVDTLNKYGFPSFMVHDSDGFRCTWFPNETPVRCLADVPLDLSDYWVLPEIYGWEIERHAPGCRKVIFNQNSYLTFHRFPLTEADPPDSYWRDDVVGVMVVSEDNREYLEYAFPGLLVRRIHHEIDQALFPYQSKKKQRIAFMPRKNRDDAVQVINILKSRNVLDGFELVAIDGMSHPEVAEILKETLVFLSFGYPEGAPMPASEAMSCGCVVIGYHGGGGREYFKPEFSYPVLQGEIVAFARTVEEVIDTYRTEPRVLAAQGRMASEFIAATYSRSAWEKDILDFWKEVLGDSNAGGKRRA
jgi:Glycosyl transferases group 1